MGRKGQVKKGKATKLENPGASHPDRDSGNDSNATMAKIKEIAHESTGTHPPMTQTGEYRWTLTVGLLLMTSGACALLYQVAWLRELRLLFGGTTAASAAVLAIFMAGLGLGNVLLGRYVDRFASPLRLYALLEWGIALSSALTPWLIDLTGFFYLSSGGETVLGTVGATWLRLSLTALVLLIPTILMGGTLPAAVAAVTSANDTHRGAAGTLYGLNTLGALVGTLLGTFVLLQTLGTRWTLWLACLLNASVAMAAWWLARRHLRAATASIVIPMTNNPTPATNTNSHENNPSHVSTSEPGIKHHAVLFAATATLGFTFMLLELVWYRMLAPLLGGTTYTFGLILAVALLGMGIGGALYPVFFARRGGSLATLAMLCGLEAIAVAIPLALGDRLALATLALEQANTLGFAGAVLGWSAIATIVVLPASVFSGLQFPLIIALLGKAQHRVGQQVGLAYLANTIGGIVGSLAGGFGLMPLLTAPGCWRGAVLMLAGLALVLVLPYWSGWRPSRQHGQVAGLVVISLLLLVFPGPSGLWRHGGIGAGRSGYPQQGGANAQRAWQHERHRTILWEADGVEAGVAIAHGVGPAFLVNGKSDGNAITDAGTQINLGLLPALLHGEPRSTFVVGLGTGETAGWLAEVPSVTNVDVAEIEPAVAEMARRCHLVNHDVLNHPKVRILWNDAREVLLTTPNHYDLIVSEPSNPYRAGIANLYTREFYQAVSRRLQTGGVFAQWLQTYEVDEESVAIVMATVTSTFSHVEIWQTKANDLLLICCDTPLRYSYDHLQKSLQREPYGSGMGRSWRTTTAEGILARFVGGGELARVLAKRYKAQPNSDDRNVLEYGFARTCGRDTQFGASNLVQLAEEIGAHRPEGMNAQVDWLAVADHRAALYCTETYTAWVDSQAGPAHAVRCQALERFYADNSRGMIAFWEKQPLPARLPTEVALLALAYAEFGDSKALPLLDKLRSFDPHEAHLIEGILAWRQGKPETAATTLAEALRALRHYPWPLPNISNHALGVAEELAIKHPLHAPTLYNAVREPFAVLYLDERRRLAALYIAVAAAPDDVPTLMNDFEPYVPWTEAFLDFRSKMYSAIAHPRAISAQRDLKTFRSEK